MPPQHFFFELMIWVYLFKYNSSQVFINFTKEMGEGDVFNSIGYQLEIRKSWHHQAEHFL